MDKGGTPLIYKTGVSEKLTLSHHVTTDFLTHKPYQHNHRTAHSKNGVSNIHIGVDSFIYYSEGDITKCVVTDIHIVFGVEKYPLRRSFYTWVEGAVPVAVFKFHSDSTAHQDRDKKVSIYMNDIGVQEYFILQPEMKKPSKFRGAGCRPVSGEVIEIEPDEQGCLFSEALNLLFRWEDDQNTHVRFLRPYLPDNTPITTSMEEEHLRKQEQHLRKVAEAIAAEETSL